MNGAIVKAVIYVALGGMLGSVGRYLTAELVTKLFPKAGFPYGTFVVNVVGCFLIGWLLLGRKTLSEDVRLLVAIGILGGFTTFSAFGLETLTMLEDQRRGAAAANVAANLVFGLGAVWLGSKWTH